jgi:hypothetical protein
MIDTHRFTLLKYIYILFIFAFGCLIVSEEKKRAAKQELRQDAEAMVNNNSIVHSFKFNYQHDVHIFVFLFVFVLI